MLSTSPAREQANPESLEITYEVMRERSGMAWIGLYRPDCDEIDSVAAEFGLHRLAVEDAVAADQRPKLDTVKPSRPGLGACG
jgi:magnesium transporter